MVDFSEETIMYEEVESEEEEEFFDGTVSLFFKTF